MKKYLLLLFLIGCVSKSPSPVQNSPLDTQNYFWTGKGDHTPLWDKIVLESILPFGPKILEAEDMKDFCPKFPSLGIEDKKRVVVQFIAAIVNYESSFKLNTYSKEPISAFPDLDHITQRPVASEGLLQLSYQDQDSYKGKFDPGVCVFYWIADKALKETDPKKSIFDPRLNLQCGIAILNLQVVQHKTLAYDKSYWSTLRPNGKYGQISGIKSIVKNFGVCK